MKLYLEGLVNGVAAILAAALVALAFRGSSHVGDIALIAFMVLGVASGYIYRRRYGPMVWSADGLGVKRIARFLLGFGTLLGPAKLWLGGFPDSHLNAFVNLGLLAISVPLAGFSMAGLFFAGSWVAGKWQ